MKRSFKEINAIAKRYVKIKYLKIDGSWKYDMIEKESKSIKSKNQITSTYNYSEILDNHLRGNNIDKYFFNDKYIKEILTDEQIEILVNEGKINKEVHPFCENHEEYNRQHKIEIENEEVIERPIFYIYSYSNYETQLEIFLGYWKCILIDIVKKYTSHIIKTR